MSRDRYVAYVGTYTNGEGKGIHIYDMDVEKGTLTERKTIDVNNASYLVKSNNGKYLYSIEDEGVKAFRILEDGDLEVINEKPIGGMRGCYLSTDEKDKFLFVAGYHDGKVTVLRLKSDGAIGEITDEVFHKGIGGIAERSFRPHVNCVRLTPDQKYLCAVDLGVDHVKIYDFNHRNGQIKLLDLLRCELDSGPRHMLFSSDGKFAYVICQMKNIIDVYAYKSGSKGPKFEKVQTMSTLEGLDVEANGLYNNNAASALKLSRDEKYLYCSNAGKNTIAIFERNTENGELSLFCNLPISGDYPKDIDVFPDCRHIMSLNHESGDLTLFAVNEETRAFYRHTKPLSVKKGNCILVSKID